MPVWATVAGSIAVVLLVFLGATFLVAPTKANEWFGTWTTQGESPTMLRIYGLVFIVLVLLFADLIYAAISGRL
jgi:hypothetical protein